MSVMPSPLKSPVPATDHVVGMFPTAAVDATVVPFMNQIEVLPRLSYHGMSVIPPPFKSPVPITIQEVDTTPNDADDSTSAPLISHRARWLVLSRQRMSPKPSEIARASDRPLVGTLPTARDCEICVPFMNQIAVFPVWSRHRRSLLPSPLKSRSPTIDQTAGTNRNNA
jgi:hypothetical protein